MHIQAHFGANDFRKSRLQVGLVCIPHRHRKRSTWEIHTRSGAEGATRTRDLGDDHTFWSATTNLHWWSCICHCHSRCNSSCFGRHFVCFALLSTRKTVSRFLSFIFHIILFLEKILQILFPFDLILFSQIWSTFWNIFSKYLSHMWRAQVNYRFTLFLHSLVIFGCLCWIYACRVKKWKMKSELFFIAIDVRFVESRKRISMQTLCKWCNIPITTISRPPVWKVWRTWTHSSIILAWIRTGDHFSKVNRVQRELYNNFFI